jgi:glycosyltransferase involved in cell wall biosynthesis
VTLRRMRADVVHFQWPVEWLDHGAFLKRLRRAGIRTLFTAHDVLPHEPRPEDRAIYDALYHSGAEIIVHSEQNRTELLAAFRPDPERVHVVPMGSFGFLGEAAGDPRTARERLDLPIEARVVLFFGLIRPYKGLEDLLHAFTQVIAREKDAWLLVVGAPVGPAGEAYYRQMIDACGIAHRTRFLPEYLPPEAVAVPFLAADVVALPYRRASQSAVLQVAYAFGKPAVGTRAGGLPEVIEEGRSGALVEPGDVAGLAEALADLLADDVRRAEMGRRARWLSETRFSWSTIAATTLQLYEGVRRSEGSACAAC